MAPESYDGSQPYTAQIKLKLDKLNNNQIQNVNIDLTQIDINMLTSQIDVLSDAVELYMRLLTSNIYYVLNDRTIHLLMKGDIDMSAVTDNDSAETLKERDAVVQDLLATETDVDLFVVDKNKTRSGGAFFTIYDLDKYGILKLSTDLIISILVYM